MEEGEEKQERREREEREKRERASERASERDSSSSSSPSSASPAAPAPLNNQSRFNFPTSTQRTVHPTVQKFLQKVVPQTISPAGIRNIQSETRHCYCLNWSPPDASQVMAMAPHNPATNSRRKTSACKKIKRHAKSDRKKRTIQIEYDNIEEDGTTKRKKMRHRTV